MNIYHRYFAQYMLTNGVSTVDKALIFCKHISQGKIENMTHLRTLVVELNREISKQFYKIVFSVCEVTNQDVIVWLNTKTDDISKLQITYSAIELEYFHAILQEILNTSENRITFIVCINITSTLTAHFSRDSGQKVLNKWIEGGYYIRDGEFICLGPRTILEFTSYLRSHYPDSICNLCSELVFTGRKCGYCCKVLHSYCLSTYLQNQDKCPCCKTIWSEILGQEQPRNIVNSDDENEEMSTDEEKLQASAQPPSEVCPISQNSRLLHRTRSSQQHIDADESGPSNRKRHK